MEINLTTYPVQILTRDYMVTGELTPRGNPQIFLNDPQAETLTVNNAETIALIPGGTISTLKAGRMMIPRTQVQILVLGEYTEQDAQLLPRIEMMVCFTDTFIVRGGFHLSVEAGVQDVFTTRGPFYPITTAEILMGRPLAEEVGGEAEIMFLYGGAVQTYYAEEKQE